MTDDLSRLLGASLPNLPGPFIPKINEEAFAEMQQSMTRRQDELALIPAAAIIAVELIRRGVVGPPNDDSFSSAMTQIGNVMGQVLVSLQRQREADREPAE